MLTEEQLEIISSALQPLFQYLEQEVITDIVRRIKETMKYTLTAEREAEAMQRLGFSPARIRKEAMKILKADAEYRKQVARNTLEYKREIRKKLREISREAYKAGDKIMSEVGNLALENDLRIWKEHGKELTDTSYLSELTGAFSAQTAGELKNLTQSAGFKMMSGFESIENAYRSELDKAVIKLCSGAFSQETVLRDTVRELAKSGLRSIDYASGYSTQLDTASRLALRTGCHQLSGRIMDANIQRTGENLVYVSRHTGARNTGSGHANHEQWQGKVYFIKEGNDYSEEARRIGQDRIMDLWYATGYSLDGSRENDPLGLYGFNCRHRHYPWFIGSSTLPKVIPDPKPVTIDGRTYDFYAATQRMRAMERAVRALRREKEALTVLGLDTKEITARIRQRTAQYKDFCKACGVPEATSRMRVEGGTSDLTKTKAWKRYEQMKNAHSNAPGESVFFDETSDYRIELEGYPEAVNNGMSKAAREVAQKGSQTGWEHMRLVNLKTGAIDLAHTDKEQNSVGGHTLWKYLEDHPDETYAFIHNHNVATELSLPDVEIMMSEKQIPIVASVRNDGIIYSVESNGKNSNEIPYIRYEKEAEEFSRNYGDKTMSYQFTQAKEMFFRDKVIEEFAKGGMKVHGIR